MLTRQLQEDIALVLPEVPLTFSEFLREDGMIELSCRGRTHLVLLLVDPRTGEPDDIIAWGPGVFDRLSVRWPVLG